MPKRRVLRWRILRLFRNQKYTFMYDEENKGRKNEAKNESSDNMWTTDAHLRHSEHDIPQGSHD